VTKAGGIAPARSPPRVSIPRVGAAGPPGASLTLKPALAHVSRQPVTTASRCSRLEREGPRKSETRGLGATVFPITAKSGHGAIFNPEPGVFIVSAQGKRGTGSETPLPATSAAARSHGEYREPRAAAGKATIHSLLHQDSFKGQGAMEATGM